MKKHTVTLPVDLIIIEILLRLPVKSVLRFKCVCRSWLSLISNPQFGISHHDLAAAPSHRLLFRSNDYYIESVDTEAQLEKDSSGVHLVLPPPSPPCYRSYYNCYHHVRIKPEILGSCRGLLLLFYERSDDLILWNPSMGVHKRLQDAKFFEMTREYLYGFGYDASQDDYLLILISWPVTSFHDTKTNIKVFSLKTYSWNIYDSNVSCSVLVDNNDGSLLNGAIHWLVFSEDKKVPIIMAFDLIQRSLSDIPLFDHFAMEFSMMKYQAFSLRVLGEALSLCFSVRDTATTEIWVMKEYKVKSSWTKFIVIPTNDCFSLICITKDGGILGSNIYGRLEKRNDKGELLEDLMHHGEERLYLANLQSAMYRESLVSLPSVIGGNK